MLKMLAGYRGGYVPKRKVDQDMKQGFQDRGSIVRTH